MFKLPLLALALCVLAAPSALAAPASPLTQDAPALSVASETSTWAELLAEPGLAADDELLACPTTTYFTRNCQRGSCKYKEVCYCNGSCDLYLIGNTCNAPCPI
jgi:hypothetical protein